MKTKNTVLTLAAIILSVFTLSANPVSRIAVIGQQKTATFKVIYEGANAGKVTLKVFDTKNNEVFSESINGLSKFMRPLNFDGMEYGIYTIEITDESGKQIQQVNYHGTDAKSETSIKALHVSKLQDGKYLVSVANDGTEKINIRIYDNNENLVYNDYHTSKGGLGLVYNLKNVTGTPVFMITDNSGKNLTIK